MILRIKPEELAIKINGLRRADMLGDKYDELKIIAALQKDAAAAKAEQNKAENAKLTPFQEAYEKQRAKNRADFEEENNKAILAGNESSDYINTLKSYMSDSSFSNAVGPYDAMVTGIYGLSSTREMRGKIDAITGELMLATARLEKGQTSNNEREQIKQYKPKISDSESTFAGKVDAIDKIRSRLLERRNRIAELLRDPSIDENQAISIAQREVPLFEGIPSTESVGTAEMQGITPQETYSGPMVEVEDLRSGKKEYIPVQRAIDEGIITKEQAKEQGLIP